MSDVSEVNLPQPPVRERRKPGPKPKAAVEARPETNDEGSVEQPRARMTRAEATRRERRRRESNDHTSDMKLGVRFKKDPNKVYRWINAGIDNQRLKDKTIDDDWDLVSAEGEVTSDTGTAVRRAVGQNQSGPIYSYLCCKEKDWHEADQRKKQERNDDMMRHIRQGASPLDISPGLGRRGLTQSDHVYGQEGISLNEGRK